MFVRQVFVFAQLLEFQLIGSSNPRQSDSLCQEDARLRRCTLCSRRVSHLYIKRTFACWVWIQSLPSVISLQLQWLCNQLFKPDVMKGASLEFIHELPYMNFEYPWMNWWVIIDESTCLNVKLVIRALNMEKLTRIEEEICGKLGKKIPSYFK